MSRFFTFSSSSVRARRQLAIAALAGLATGAGVASSAYATSYASNVAVTGGGTQVNFVLNENADVLTYSINGGAAVSLPGGKGAKTFNIAPGDTFSIIAENSDIGYTTSSGATIQQTAFGLSQPTAAAVTRMISNDDALTKFFSPRGVDVSRNPNSPNFGTAYVANSAAGTSSGRAVGDGLYAIRADGSDAYGFVNTAANPSTIWPAAGGANSPFRVHVSRGTDGDVFVAGFSDANSNVFRVNANMTTGQEMFGGSTGPTVLPVGQNHGSTTAVYTEGSVAGGDLKIWTLDEDLTIGGAAQNSLWRYDVLNNPAPYNGTPTKINQTNVLVPLATSDLDRGADGKFYLGDTRSAGAEAGIIVLDTNGNKIYDSLTESRALLANPTANDIARNIQAIAVSPDQKWLAALINQSDVMVVPIKPDGTPDLANRRMLDAGVDINSGRDIAFDAAGNIHYVSSGQGLYRVLAPGGHTVSTTTWDGTQFGFSTATVAGGSATLFWDTNGGTAGSGGPTPSGNWDGTAANFTTDAGGNSGTTQANTAGLDIVNFAAGGDGTGTYTVTVSGLQRAGSMNVTQGNVSFTGGTIRPNEINVSAGASATVESTLGGGFTKSGAGTLNITGTTANTAPGLVYVTGGNLVLNKTGAVAALTNDVQINGGTVTLAASNQIDDFQNLTVTSGTFDLGADHNETLNVVTLDGGTISGTGTSTLLVNTSSSNATFDIRSGTADVILGGVGRVVTKTTAGTATFTKANTYAGGTTISAGTLAIGDNASLGTGTVTLNGGGLRSSSAAARTLANNFIMNANSNVSGTGAITINGTFTNSGANRTFTSTNTATTTLGNLFLSEAAATGRTLTLAGASSVNPTFVVSGVIANAAAAGAGNGNLTIGGTTVANASTVTLSGANTYSGTTTINIGSRLKYGADNVIPSGAGKGNVPVTGTLDLNGFSGTVNNLTGSGTVTNSGANPSTITVGANDQTGLFTGTVSNTGASLALVKTGTGTLTLGGANSHGGGTTVSGGALILGNADALGTGSLNVSDSTLATAQAALPKAVSVTTLNTNTSGKFDLTNNSMVVKGMADTAVRTLLQSGYSGGAWNGATGIVSTAVTAETSVGYATQAQVGVTDFKGVSGLAASDVLVKYTYAGDANLDGKVDIGDLGLLAGAWQQLTGKVWFDGDFTYDGAVDIGDLGLLAGNWQKGTAGNPNPPLMDFNTALAQFSAFDGVVVPEPTSLALLALGGGLALGRRRRVK